MDQTTKEFQPAIHELSSFAEAFWSFVDGCRVFAFHGEMGAGKTTLVHALCLARGVREPVTSPTFSLINEYLFEGGLIYHIDLYRIADEEEARRAGIEDCLYSDHICLVEWPEKAPGIFPPGSVDVFIEPLTPEVRTIKIRKPG